MVEPCLALPKESLLLPFKDESYARWLALARIQGLGCATFRKIADHLNDPTRLFSASEKELAAIPGLDPEVIQGAVHFSAWDEVESELERVRQAGFDLVTYNDPAYPSRLRMISDPPPYLYVKGELRNEDRNAVAVVGSRSASEYGRRVAGELCRSLALLGFTVVSGMARGIDGTAHEAALEAGGRTIAVLGSGLDVPYPTEHEGLYHRISERGAVVSEFSMGTRPLAYHFPSRNRLISGLSLGVVVVEATEKSGSLITAGLALEQGREVFAVPGEVGSSRSRGTHRLIRQGAKLVETVQDILEEIAPQLSIPAGASKNKSSLILPEGVSSEARRVFELVRERPLQIDEVIETSGLSPSRVSEILLDLELQGFLRQLPGKTFTIGR